ncbi:NAD(P)H-binding protein [Arthrobacter sp. 35W]|uniref:NAD(P)H-binding protein n=1 Tax=Arthrobacter sp. 35W TaxID=1132441 RepID=UPI00040983C2|nr:NAD(P)H-binding protein [Arthrobacter sp. 35W]
MARILIIGGHGKIALQLAEVLTRSGHQATSVIRRDSQAARIAETGAQPLVLDVEHCTTAELAAAMAGHDAVVWSAGAGGGNPERTYAVDRDAAIMSMAAAAEAGVERYVMVSYLGARRDHGIDPENSFFAYAEAKAAADDHLRGTGLDWTILAPGALTDEPSTGRINPEPSGSDTRTSRASVALVAAAVLELPGTAGRTIRFTDGGIDIAEALGGP